MRGLMVVPIETEPNFAAGTPEVAVENQYYISQAARSYDIAPDGQRFLFIKEGTGQTTEGQSGPQLILVQNWFEEVKRLVPMN